MAISLSKPISEKDIKEILARLEKIEQTLSTHEESLVGLNITSCNAPSSELTNKVDAIEKAVIQLIPKIDSFSQTASGLCDAMLILKQQLDTITMTLKVRGLM